MPTCYDCPPWQGICRACDQGATPPSGPGAEPQLARGPAEGPKYDYEGEELHWEGTPHRGDLVTNLALGATLLWLPLTAAAVGRGAFIKFRFTDKRVSVITAAPWKSARPAGQVLGEAAMCEFSLECRR